MVAATDAIPLGFMNNLAFASGYNYLFAAVPGANAVFVYNVVNLIAQVQYSLNDVSTLSWLSKYPVDLLLQSQILPQQENLQLANTGIDVKADYRIIKLNPFSGDFTIGVPHVYDQNGNPTTQGNPPKAKYSPRVGVVYSIDPKTVLRSGYGLYWSPYNYPAPSPTSNIRRTAAVRRG